MDMQPLINLLHGTDIDDLINYALASQFDPACIFVIVEDSSKKGTAMADSAFPAIACYRGGGQFNRHMSW